METAEETTGQARGRADRRAGREPGAPAERAFRALLRTLGLIRKVMEPYFAQHGISGPQWAVLRNLHRAEQEGLAGLRLSDLGERLLIRPPSVTGVVDRLERQGLLARRRPRADLRVREVRLTAAGRALVERLLAVHADQIRTVMGGLTLADQTELGRLLEQLDRHLAALGAPADRNGFSQNTEEE